MAALAAFSLALAVFAVISSMILVEFTKVLPKPYMDEIFHIPQAQNYCHGNFFYWDDKITTLPGLYFSSQFFLKVLSSIQNIGVRDVCSVMELRSTNVIFIILVFSLIYLIVEQHNSLEFDGNENKNSDGKHVGKRGNSNVSIFLSMIYELFISTFLFS